VTLQKISVKYKVLWLHGIYILFDTNFPGFRKFTWTRQSNFNEKKIPTLG